MEDMEFSIALEKSIPWVLWAAGQNSPEPRTLIRACSLKNRPFGWEVQLLFESFIQSLKITIQSLSLRDWVSPNPSLRGYGVKTTIWGISEVNPCLTQSLGTFSSPKSSADLKLDSGATEFARAISVLLCSSQVMNSLEPFWLHQHTMNSPSQKSMM